MTTRSDELWGRISGWLAKRPVKECFLETFDLVDQLCDALEIAETAIKNPARRRKSLELVRRARAITGRET